MEIEVTILFPMMLPHKITLKFRRYSHFNEFFLQFPYILYAGGWLWQYISCEIIDVTGCRHRSLAVHWVHWWCWGDHRSHHSGSAEGKSGCLWRWCWPIRGRAGTDWWDPFETPQSRDFPLIKIFACDSKKDSLFWFVDCFSSLPDLRKKDEIRRTVFRNHLGGWKEKGQV